MKHSSRRFLRCSCVVVAFAPVAASLFLACGTNEAPPRTPTTTGSAAANVVEPTASAATTASTPSTASTAMPTPASASAGVGTGAPSAIDSAGAASSASATAPPTVKLIEYYGKCAAAGAVATFINAHRTCTVDGDCAVVTTAGGTPGACGVGIAKSAAVELRAKSDAAFKACSKAGIPMPIPTCPPPPPPRCGSGWCQP